MTGATQASETVERHTTYVERDGAGYWWWCTADDCYASGRRRRYETDAEASDAAATHESHPG